MTCTQCVGLFLLVACRSPGPAAVPADPPGSPGPWSPRVGAALPEGSPWADFVSARIADGARAFVASPDGFDAVLGQGARGRFDEEVVHLSLGGHALDITTLSIGRAERTPWAADAPSLGACIPGHFAPGGDCIQRLEYAGNGVTEWWAGRRDGFEQGWTVAEPPSGAGPLTLALKVEGTDAQVRATDVHLYDGHELVATIADFAAEDADGHPLPISLTGAGNVVEIRVEDAGAAYPVEIDPVYRSPSLLLSNETDPGGFGYILTGAGDVNGDGYPDLLIGSGGTSLESGGAPMGGVAYLYLGGSSGISIRPQATLGEMDPATGFGSVLDGAGDVDGDGYDDVLVGAPGYAEDRGRVFLYPGSSLGLSTTPTFVVEGGRPGIRLGASLAGLGDIDQDGYDDIALTHGNPGRVDVYHGSSAGLPAGASTTLGPDIPGDGLSVFGPGDTNGDGYPDVGVAVTSPGGVQIYAGSATGVAATSLATLPTSNTIDHEGSVAGAGDVNGDGYDDLIIGEYLLQRAYLNLGSSTGLSTSAPIELSTDLGGAASSRAGDYGWAVAGAGDINGDGYDDVLVGGGTDPSNYVPSVYLYQGSATGLNTTPATTIAPGGYNYHYYEYFGHSLAGLGDIDADGMEDVAVGFWTGYSYFPYSSTALVYTGSSTGLSTEGTILGNEEFQKWGSDVASGGDVNGDGVGDLLVGAAAYRARTGAAFLYEGTPAGPSLVAAITLSGTTPSAEFGEALAGGGDVDGDGYDDVVIAAAAYDDHRGQAFVYHGGPSGLSEIAATTLTGASIRSNFGSDVAMAGDVNGDGYDDVVVGAKGALHSNGGAYIYYDGSDGISATLRTALYMSTPRQGSRVGRVVAGAGDLNGDGFDDVLVGGEGMARHTDRGIVNIHYGASSGIIPASALTLAGDSRGIYFGYSIAGAGDLNGDGFDDILVGAMAGSLPEGPSITGLALFYLGSSTGISRTPSSVLAGEERLDYFGYSVAGLGDTNGDGYDDVIVGTYGSNEAYLYRGSASGSWTESTMRFADDGNEHLGGLVAPAGDVNGDGYADALVGSGPHKGPVAIFLGCLDEDADGVCAGEDCDDADSAAPALLRIYPDADGDGFGVDAGLVTTCATMAGYVELGGDCEDGDNTIHPGATEVCDAADVDEDCNGVADDADPATAGGLTVHLDFDGDGYGNAVESRVHCDLVAPFVIDGTDCDDRRSSVHPGAQEFCDPDDRDQDCDGLADDADASPLGRVVFHVDADGDGYGTSVLVLGCDLATGRSGESGDCDDTDPWVHPGAVEVCDAADIDESCDGLADDDDPSATGLHVYYEDLDGDGYGSTNLVYACDLSAGATARGGDCDDGDPSIHPTAVEVIADGINQNCDGADAGP